MDDEKSPFDVAEVDAEKGKLSYNQREAMSNCRAIALSCAKILALSIEELDVWNGREKYQIRDYMDMCTKIHNLIHRNLQEIAYLTSEGV